MTPISTVCVFLREVAEQMLITNQQRFILDTLQRLGCIRTDQMAVLLKARFSLGSLDRAAQVTRAAVRQLRMSNTAIREEDDIIHLPRQPPNGHLLSAIDVMLELSGGSPVGYAVGNGTILLHFAAERAHTSVFAVIHASQAACMPPLSDKERVIILIDSKNQIKKLPIPNRQFFALHADGKLRFLSIEKS